MIIIMNAAIARSIFISMIFLTTIIIIIYLITSISIIDNIIIITYLHQ